MFFNFAIVVWPYLYHLRILKELLLPVLKTYYGKHFTESLWLLDNIETESYARFDEAMERRYIKERNILLLNFIYFLGYLKQVKIQNFPLNGNPRGLGSAKTLPKN